MSQSSDANRTFTLSNRIAIVGVIEMSKAKWLIRIVSPQVV